MLEVALLFRRPKPGGYFSIERYFDALRSHFNRMPGLQVRTIVVGRVSEGFWPRLVILGQLSRLRSTVYHITGDIHFAALALPGARTVLTIHDCGFMRHPNPVVRWILKKLWLQWPVRHCRQITTVSRATRQEIVQFTGCSTDKIAIVPVVIPAHFKPAPRSFCAEKPKILHIGASPNKNLRRHIEALRGIPCCLHIVGQPAPEELDLLRQHGLEYRCSANLDDEAVRRAYENCDLLLFASTFEGFGMPILEAQSIGRPVVTGDCSSMPEVAGNAACLVDPFDVASIRSGVLQVIREKTYRDQLIQNGFANIRRFQPAHVADEYARLYRKLAGH